MAWQTAQRMDPAPGGSCSGVRQPEQFTSIIMARGVWKGILGIFFCDVKFSLSVNYFGWRCC